MADIALIGQARSGKDTVAARLVAEHGYTRVAFADPLKELALKINPAITYSIPDFIDAAAIRLADLVDHIGWERAKDGYPEVRRILQHTGQAIRDLDPDFWVRAALTKINDLHPAAPVVVTDVRYPNEADALRAEGFRLVRVVRPYPNTLEGEAAAHASETAMDDYPADALIMNAWSLDELHRRTDALIA